MKYVFLLSKENIDMSRDEVLSVVNCKSYSLDDNLFIADVGLDKLDFISNRLGFTKKIFRLLFSCKVKDIVENFKEYDWNGVYKKNFSIRIDGKTDYSEKELAGYVWEGLTLPRVSLVDSKTPIFVFFRKDNVYCCLLEREIRHDYDIRKAHKRPELHPSSLHPRLARVLVNLTGISKGEIIDPFCGSGGILIEAGLMGLSVVGYDIDQIMLNRAKINLLYYEVNDFKLNLKDALKLKSRISYIVTDLPYGKNTKKTEQNI